MIRDSFQHLAADEATLSGVPSRAGSKPHIVVAGAGIIGSSIAYHLVRRGAQVTLLDKGQPGGGTTANSFAWINATFSKQPWHYFLLNGLGIEAWKQLERELDGALKVQWDGSIKWHGEGEEAGLLREQVRHHQGWGYGTQLVDEAQLGRLEPHVQFGEVAVAAYCEQEGHIDPVHAVQVLVDKASQLGARVETGCEVTGLEVDDGQHGQNGQHGQLRAVQTTKGEIEADVLVVACGVDTPRVAALAGLNVPLKDSPGLLLHTTPQAPLLNGIVLAPGAHMKQKPDGRIVTGANFGGSPTTDTSAESAKRMLAQAARFLPQLKDAKIEEAKIEEAKIEEAKIEEAKIEKVTLGWRVLPEDDYPIIGYAGTQPPIYLAVMHSGITLAALVGRLAAVELLDGVQVELLQPYRLERFRRKSQK